MRVLVVEDSEVDQFLVVTFLENFFKNVTVETANDGLKALELCNTHDYDLTFLDINMPSMGGFEFLNSLCQAKCDPKIIMLSSSLHDEEREKALSYSCVGAYIEKPLKEENLEVIEAVLKGQTSG
jgi:CheY-like chemotaxis protein